MNHQHWQSLHKDAMSSGKEEKSGTTKNLSEIEIIHLRALALLKWFCLPEELESLLELARQYDSGERLHDTHFMD